jgi:hypothetical protein
VQGCGRTPGGTGAVCFAMHQNWDWSGDIQRHVETLKDSQAKMLGKGFAGGSGGGGYPAANSSGEPLQR